jgi:hypothetical protein
MAYDPELDQTFDCLLDGAAGIIKIEVTMDSTGNWPSEMVFAMLLDIFVSVVGDWAEGVYVDVSENPIEIFIGLVDSDVLLERHKRNWAAWSRIGDARFTKGRDNIAGDRPMDWAGWIYDIRMIVGKPVVYGENGVTLMPPTGNAFGMQTIHQVGLESKLAVTGTDVAHWFIDNLGRLYEVTGEGIEKLDYSEYLSQMSGITMNYDPTSELLYICDNEYGFVYSPRDRSLGSGPINVTGVGVKSGVTYIAAPADIIIPNFEMCTDIYDFKSRDGKSIHSIEYATDVDGDLFASIDYRGNKGEAFTQTDWYLLDARGMAFITCYGYEFRFRGKLATYEYFEVDEVIVDVTEHSH